MAKSIEIHSFTLDDELLRTIDSRKRALLWSPIFSPETLPGIKSSEE